MPNIVIVLLIAVFLHIENDKPEINELFHKVVPQVAVDWEDLGLSLGLEREKLNIISSDNKYNPDRTVECCKRMLVHWLKVDPSATWGKLYATLTWLYNSGPNSELITLTFMCYCTLMEECLHLCYIKQYAKQVDITISKNQALEILYLV